MLRNLERQPTGAILFVHRRPLVVAALMLCSCLLSTSSVAAVRSAGPGEVCEEDKDNPVVPRRVLVMDLFPEGEAEPSLAGAFAEDMRAAVSERDDLVLFSTEAAVELGIDNLKECRRSDCLSEIAEQANLSFIIYGTLKRATIDGAIGWDAEVRVFDATEGRPLAKTNAKSTEPGVIGEALRVAGPGLVPMPPKLKVVDCGPPALVERPLFILGTAITMTGVVAFLGAGAWALDLEQKLGSPEAHRQLKWEAIIYGPYALGLTVASLAIVATGVGFLGAGVVLVEE